ncbi:hypothetical protein HKX48_005226 [Thoreauomyces humboldtii]|nr:hypothetical protein HKX48_005226 [Thoreauomyces humboldtii]
MATVEPAGDAQQLPQMQQVHPLRQQLPHLQAAPAGSGEFSPPSTHFSSLQLGMAAPPPQPPLQPINTTTSAYHHGSHGRDPSDHSPSYSESAPGSPYAFVKGSPQQVQLSHAYSSQHQPGDFAAAARAQHMSAQYQYQQPGSPQQHPPPQLRYQQNHVSPLRFPQQHGQNQQQQQQSFHSSAPAAESPSQGHGADSKTFTHGHRQPQQASTASSGPEAMDRSDEDDDMEGNVERAQSVDTAVAERRRSLIAMGRNPRDADPAHLANGHSQVHLGGYQQHMQQLPAAHSPFYSDKYQYHHNQFPAGFNPLDRRRSVSAPPGGIPLSHFANGGGHFPASGPGQAGDIVIPQHSAMSAGAPGSAPASMGPYGLPMMHDSHTGILSPPQTPLLQRSPGPQMMRAGVPHTGGQLPPLNVLHSSSYPNQSPSSFSNMGSLPPTSQLHPRVHNLIYDHAGRSMQRHPQDMDHNTQQRYPTPPPRPASAPVSQPTGQQQQASQHQPQPPQNPAEILQGEYGPHYPASEAFQHQQQHLVHQSHPVHGSPAAVFTDHPHHQLPHSLPQHQPPYPYPQQQQQQQHLSDLYANAGPPHLHQQQQTHDHPQHMSPHHDPSSPHFPHYSRVPRVHKCPKPFCTKTYKNANGLKYHLDRGICEYDTTSNAATQEFAHTHRYETLEAAAAGNVKIAHRPYWCKVPACGKKYKNLNGLKYHAKAVHPDLDFRAEVKGVFVAL